MASAAASALLLIILVAAAPAAYATNHVVGGSSGWNTAVDYTTWASGQTFSVGDTLLFTYSGQHGVDEVNKADYDSCSLSSGNAINSFSDGNTTISLTKTGPRYFFCPTLGHCGQGMKLAVTVSASSGPTSGGTAPSNAPGSPTTPGTPASSSTPNSPSGATAQFGRMNGVRLGALVVLAPLVVLMV